MINNDSKKDSKIKIININNYKKIMIVKISITIGGKVCFLTNNY